MITALPVWEFDTSREAGELAGFYNGEGSRSPARWNKAIQHLREDGKLEGSPRDIALLMREIPDDIEKDCKEEIAELLYTWAWPQIRRGVCAGVPETYKQMLMAHQPTGGTTDGSESREEA